VALSKIGDKGLFVKEIEKALIGKDIHIAVHSMKDLPSFIPPELCIGAVPVRLETADVLISRNNITFENLPCGSVIGTGSLRRKSQILALRKDLVVRDIRGNLDTRIKKLESENYSAIVVAAAGLIRMGWTDKISQYFSPEKLLPAAGQGAIAIEVRKDNKEIKSLLEGLHDFASFACVMAERSFLAAIQGGCEVPAGALASLEGDILHLQGFIASPWGSKIFRGYSRGDRNNPEAPGIRLAEKLMKDGASEVLREIRSAKP